MNQIDPSFEQKLRTDPAATVRLIVRTKTPPADSAALLAQKGMRVIRTSSLINAVTVEGRAEDALRLCAEDWVARIEEDKPVRAM